MPRTPVLIRSAVLLLALGSFMPLPGAGAQVLPSFSSVPAGQTAVVFRSRTARFGAVDVLVDGQVVFSRALATDMFNTFRVPAGRHEVTVRSSYDATALVSRTLNFRSGEVAAMSFEPYMGNGDYVLQYARGLTEANALVNADW